KCTAHSPKIGSDLQRNRSTFGRTNTGLEPPSSNHTSCSGYGSTPGFRESPLTSSPEMQVFLHIGAHKTGTSTIQAALSAGGDFLYPATGRDGRRGHYPLAWSAVGRYRHRYSVPPASIWRELNAELRESDREKAIISSEFFWRAEPDEAKRIRSYLHEHDLTAILYVRH